MANSILRIFFWAGILMFVFGVFVARLLGAGSGGSYIETGVVIIVLTVFIAMLPDVLRKDQVIDKWSALIEKANGKGGEVLNTTVEFLNESKVPSLELAKRRISTGIMTGMMGNDRTFLVATDMRSLTLRPYQVFVNARDYGENLDVSWYLTCRPTFWQVLASLFAKSISIPKDMDDLNVFDQQDLTAYVTNAHHCLMKALEKVMFASGMDPSKLDTKPRGFLGIS